MSIGMDAQCYLCHLRRNVETARSLGDEATATAFAKALMELYLTLPPDAASPTIAPATNELFRKFYGLEQDRYREEKEASNAFVLQRLEEIRQRVVSAVNRECRSQSSIVSIIPMWKKERKRNIVCGLLFVIAHRMEEIVIP